MKAQMWCHCWYSAKAFQHRKCNPHGVAGLCVYLINGVEVLVTEASLYSQEPGNWNDAVYLGLGTFVKEVSPDD